MISEKKHHLQIRHDRVNQIFSNSDRKLDMIRHLVSKKIYFLQIKNQTYADS